MVNSRVFNLESGITPMSVAEGVGSFFVNDKGLVSEILETEEGIIIQAKQEDTWKKYIGMDNSVQVQILDHETSITVSIGSAKWIDKAAVGTAGVFIFAPLLVPVAVGVWQNAKLPDEIFNYIAMFISNGGKNVVQTVKMNDSLKSTEILCPKCHAKNPESVKFCNSCGEKLALECEKCGATIKQGTKFCSECGEKIVEKQAPTCPECETIIQENTKFCPECGEGLQ